MLLSSSFARGRYVPPVIGCLVSFAYEGAQLDFAKLTLTHVLLNLPMRFLCKEDCKGFEEYEEVNQHKHCRDDANVQRPFAALQQLLAEKSDNKE